MKKKLIFPLALVTTILPLSTYSTVLAETNQTNESPILSSNLKTEENYENKFSFCADGIEYEVKTVEDERFITTTIKNYNGTQEFITDKQNNKVTINSDYLSESELLEAEESFQNITKELESQDQIGIATPISETVSPVQKAPRAIKGSFAWSIWRNVTITPSNKVSAEIITAAIIGYIPYIGPVAGAIAAVFIEYNLKTGYFQYRVGTAKNTNPNYYWEKRQVRLYKNSARTILLSDKTSSPIKFFLPTS